MSDVELDQVVNLALQLSPVEQALLMERLAVAIHDSLSVDQEVDIPPFTDAEIEAMMRVEPMSGAEIVAAGLTGGWADLGITDGAEWVNERKRKRKAKLRW